jgi:hypothetical protein
VVKKFSDNSTTRTRAVQIYQILVGYAHRRQTLTYQILANLIGYKGAGVLDRQLGHLMYWCSDNCLPPLTVLVVNKTTGLPGDGLVEAGDLNADRERVFNHDWYGIVPPLPHELPDSNVG